MNNTIKWFFDLKTIHNLSTNDMYVLLYALLENDLDTSNRANFGAQIGVHESSITKAFTKLTECGLLDGKLPRSNSSVRRDIYKELNFTSKINAVKVQETKEMINEVLKNYKINHTY